jgi:hypothetical protein
MIHVRVGVGRSINIVMGRKVEERSDEVPNAESAGRRLGEMIHVPVAVERISIVMGKKHEWQ